MKISDYNYHLPDNLIAQIPLEVRDHSRLLVVKRNDGSFFEDRFCDIGNYFSTGDMLVLNDTKVVPCRIDSRKETGGKVEIMLLREVNKRLWESFLKSNKKVAAGQELIVDGSIKCVVEDKNEFFYYLRFNETIGSRTLEKIGRMPLPPYIKRNGCGRELEELDSRRYQTIYAETPGAVAAPTAGLHFTESLLENIRKKGVRIRRITLHAGAGTFLPVKAETVEDHKMFDEYYSVESDVLKEIAEAKKNGRKVIAVGTTSSRALETVHLNGNKPYKGFTDLFIYPGFEFKAVDALVTNFHLPRSTLLLLVSAFAGRDLILDAYDYAVKNRFRFYSYGDGMLIL